MSKGKLDYKIIGRRKVEGDAFDMEQIDIEWKWSNGPVTDTHLLPTTHPPLSAFDPPIVFKEVPAGKREVIKDQISVKTGTPDSVVMQICEEKRIRLAANLKLDI